jgi:hypothetical protein
VIVRFFNELSDFFNGKWASSKAHSMKPPMYAGAIVTAEKMLQVHKNMAKRAMQLLAQDSKGSKEKVKWTETEKQQ